ncbi:hypothetical protein PoB_004136700 [Plakobranchus ocellatus]|uniref:Uncharacterized protein n=1 Tax=Plakobranchus ocellatus TaxID=259542 RepID=A0AAV4B6R7_9GAST|nr:hypothetical protein PoB_004136700 [Plakobranchus ocellatus]
MLWLSGRGLTRSTWRLLNLSDGNEHSVRRSCVTVDFGNLTVRTCLTPQADVTPHAMPQELLRYGLLCKPNIRVRETMDLVGNWSSPRRRKHWLWSPHGSLQSSVDDPMSTSLSMRPVVAVRYKAISSELTWSLARQSKLIQSSPRGSVVRELR